MRDGQPLDGPGHVVAAAQVGFDANNRPVLTPGSWVRYTATAAGVTARQLPGAWAPDAAASGGLTVPPGYALGAPVRAITGAVRWGAVAEIAGEIAAVTAELDRLFAEAKVDWTTGRGVDRAANAVGVAWRALRVDAAAALALVRDGDPAAATKLATVAARIHHLVRTLLIEAWRFVDKRFAMTVIDDEAPDLPAYLCRILARLERACAAVRAHDTGE